MSAALATQMYLKHSALIREMLRKSLPHEENVAEGMHEVWLRFARFAPEFRTPYQMKIFVRNVAHCTGRDLAARSAVQRRLRRDLRVLAPAADTSLEVFIDIWELLEQRVALLPCRLRYTFLLKRVHGYTGKEIAGRLLISESAVECMLTRASRLVWDGSGDPPPFRTRRLGYLEDAA